MTKKLEDLKPEWQIFYHNFMNNPDTLYNATKSYQIAYPDASYETAGRNGHVLLKNTEINEIIKAEIELRRQDRAVDAEITREHIREMAHENVKDGKVYLSPRDKLKAAELLSRLDGYLNNDSTITIKTIESKKKELGQFFKTDTENDQE